MDAVGKIIRSLQWAIEIRRVNILHKVLLLSKHLALPREGYLEQVIHVVWYLKSHKKMNLCFDSRYPKVSEFCFKEYGWFDFYREAKELISPNKPEEQGKHMVITCFVDANHAGDRADCCSHTVIELSVNKDPIH